MRIITSLLLIAAMLGCSSQPARIQYYLLFSPEKVQNLDLQQSQRIKLARLDIPDYLQQRGLPVMVNDNQLHISKNHMWAESFESGVTKLLTYGLSPNYLLVDSNKENERGLELSVKILHLIPTDAGEVVFSAQYHLYRNDKLLFSRAYSTTYPLIQDGFSNTVNIYKQALITFTHGISKQLDTL